MSKKLRESVDAFSKGDLDSSLGSLREYVGEHNQSVAASLRGLSRLALFTRDRNDAARAQKARDIFRDLQVIPSISEPLANAVREHVGSSYRAQRMTAWRMARAAKRAPEKYLSRKDRARQFSREIGLPLPQTFQEGVSHDRIELPARAVVKPLREDGGRAVYGFQREGEAFKDLFGGKVYDTMEAVRSALRDHLDSRFVMKDEWIVEELIAPKSGDPADSADIKFFCFYGRVGYILQVERWHQSGTRRIMFDRNGTPVDASNFYRLPDGPIVPKFSAADIAMAEDVSLKIPWPGIRIDFLTSERGLVFGEFTFNPGAYGGFHPEADRFLGGEWAQASARLFDDLLAGKSFEAYTRFVEAVPRSAQ